MDVPLEVRIKGDRISGLQPQYTPFIRIGETYPLIHPPGPEVIQALDTPRCGTPSHLHLATISTWSLDPSGGALKRGDTLPKTNSKNRPFDPKGNQLVFQPSIFRCKLDVSFREVCIFNCQKKIGHILKGPHTPAFFSRPIPHFGAGLSLVF